MLAFSTDGAAVHVHSVNPTTGGLEEVPGSPFAIPGRSSDLNIGGAQLIAVDVAGKYLYVGVRSGANSITAISIDTMTGALTVVPGGPLKSSALGFVPYAMITVKVQ